MKKTRSAPLNSKAVENTGLGLRHMPAKGVVISDDGCRGLLKIERTHMLYTCHRE
jgi:hypothetical protein